ncbi:hypothetical protein AMTRI_Chr09g12200 [Amborella trichopoda]
MAAAGAGGFVLGASNSSGRASSFPNIQNINHPPIIIGPLNHHGINNNRRLRQSGGPITVRAGPLTKKVCPGFITKQQQQRNGGGGSPFPLSLTTNTTDNRKHKNQVPVSYEDLDQWMVDSIPEIVRNIGKVPFLIYVYSPMDGEGRRWQEIVGVDSWNEIRRSLNERGPDGIILVEELLNKQDDDDAQGPVEGACSTSTKLWGLLIQGRGADDSCSSSCCYILKTTRICSTVGFCTHFCLAKAKCFGEAASLQLRNSWLHNK